MRSNECDLVRALLDAPENPKLVKRARRSASKVLEHLDGCAACQGLLQELGAKAQGDVERQEELVRKVWAFHAALMPAPTREDRKEARRRAQATADFEARELEDEARLSEAVQRGVLGRVGRELAAELTERLPSERLFLVVHAFEAIRRRVSGGARHEGGRDFVLTARGLEFLANVPQGEPDGQHLAEEAETQAGRISLVPTESLIDLTWLNAGDSRERPSGIRREDAEFLYGWARRAVYFHPHFLKDIVTAAESPDSVRLTYLGARDWDFPWVEPHLR